MPAVKDFQFWPECMRTDSSHKYKTFRSWLLHKKDIADGKMPSMISFSIYFTSINYTFN
jgi:hypothetical protein